MHYVLVIFCFIERSIFLIRPGLGSACGFTGSGESAGEFLVGDSASVDT